MAVLMMQQHANCIRRSAHEYEKQKGGRKAALRVLASVARRDLPFATNHGTRFYCRSAQALEQAAGQVYGISKTLPVVWRASSARCADAASRSGTWRSTRTRSVQI